MRLSHIIAILIVLTVAVSGCKCPSQPIDVGIAEQNVTNAKATQGHVVQLADSLDKILEKRPDVLTELDVDWDRAESAKVRLQSDTNVVSAEEALLNARKNNTPEKTDE